MKKKKKKKKRGHQHVAYETYQRTPTNLRNFEVFISSMIGCCYYIKYEIFEKGRRKKRKKQQVGLEPTTIIGRGCGLATRILLQLQATNHQALIYLRNVMFFIHINTAINSRA